MKQALARFKRLSRRYESVRSEAEQAWFAACALTRMNHDATTGNPMLDYCIGFGTLCEGMMERYQAINSQLKGQVGQLVCVHRNESEDFGLRKKFAMGILIADKLEFPHKLNCFLPVGCYVTHEHKNEGSAVALWAKNHPSRLAEKCFDLSEVDRYFWVPEDESLFGKCLELMRRLEAARRYPHQTLKSVTVTVGNENVERLFIGSHFNGALILEGSDVFNRLHTRLRRYMRK